jgi:hexosaminidase
MGGAAASLTDEEKARILGGESCMWAEYVNPENIDSRIWPRNAVIAERLWSPQEIKDPDSMHHRMEFLSNRMEWLGLTHKTYYRQMLQRIAGGSATPEEFAALNTLANVVEPVKNYTREETAPAEPTSATPLNRLVDAVPLESSAARQFAEAVDKFIASSCHDAALQTRLHGEMTAWRDNDAKLQPLAQRSFLVREIAGSSEDLSTVGSIGLATLDYISKGQRLSEDWRAEQLTALQQAAKPKAQLLIMPAPAVQKLVEAAASGGACAASN